MPLAYNAGSSILRTASGPDKAGAVPLGSADMDTGGGTASYLSVQPPPPLNRVLTTTNSLPPQKQQKEGEGELQQPRSAPFPSRRDKASTSIFTRESQPNSQRPFSADAARGRPVTAAPLQPGKQQQQQAQPETAMAAPSAIPLPQSSLRRPSANGQLPQARTSMPATSAVSRSVSFAKPEVQGQAGAADPANGAGGNPTLRQALSPPPSQPGSARASSGPPPAPTAVGGSGLKLRAEGLMAPPASDAASLRRQVAALQSDLEAHVQGESRLQSINLQLRERLELYQAQNHENVERAEAELSALHADMERALELQSQLAERAASLEREKHYIEAALEKRVADFEGERAQLQARIEDMSEAVRTRAEATRRAEELKVELESVVSVKARLEGEVQRACSEADYVKRKAEEYSSELRALIQKEQKEEMINRYARRALQRRLLLHFKDAVRHQRAARAKEKAAVDCASRHTSCRGLRAWALATRRARRVRLVHERQDTMCKVEVWAAWRLEVAVGHRKRAVEYRQRAWTLEEALQCWHLFVEGQRKARVREATALRHRKHTLTRWALGLWRAEVAHAQESLEALERKGAEADVHFERSRKRRALCAWLVYIDDVARPKAAKLAKAEAHYWRSLCQNSIWAWQDALAYKAAKQEQARAAVLFAGHWSCRRAWLAWRAYCLKRRQIRQLKQTADRAFLQHRFQQWNAVLHAVREEASARERGDQARALLLRRACFRGWGLAVARRRQARLSNALAFSHYLGVLRSLALGAWKEGVAMQKAERKAERDAGLGLLRAAWHRWRQLHAHKLQKRRALRRAEVHHGRAVQRKLRHMMEAWVEVHGEWQWRKRICNTVQKRRQRALLRACVEGWKRTVHEALREAHLAVHTQYIENQGKCDEQGERISAVDMENLQLIDRLHQLSGELSSMRAQLKERDRHQEHLQRVIEDSAVLENSLRTELEQGQVAVRALEGQVAELQRMLAGKNEEDTAVEVRHALEMQQMQQQMGRLQQELSHKVQQLESTQQALREADLRLEGAAAASQEKLASAFEIAASLRQLVEDKEARVASLEQERQRAELQLSEVQRKLTAANQALRETVDAKEARINDLEGQLAQQQALVQKGQLQVQELTLALDRKTAAIRKLEYEVKLLTEREQSKAEAFLSSLLPRPPTPEPELAATHSSPVTRGAPAEEGSASPQPPAEDNTAVPGQQPQERGPPPVDPSNASPAKYQPQEQARPLIQKVGNSTMPAFGGGSGLALKGGVRSRSWEGTGYPTSSQQGRGVAPPQEFWGNSRGTALHWPEQGRRGAVGAQEGNKGPTEGGESGVGVENLHAEIQKLQTRIMNRLRDNSSKQDEELREQPRQAAPPRQPAMAPDFGHKYGAVASSSRPIIGRSGKESELFGRTTQMYASQLHSAAPVTATSSQSPGSRGARVST